MKIAVVGTGAMGSVYAALLASGGHEVWGIDRWREHVDAIREEGLQLEGPSGDRVVRFHATTDAAEVGEATLVVIATKALDVEAAAEAARPLVGTETLVLSIQNGLGGPARAAAVLGERRVAIGVAGGFGASVVAPGKVHHHGLEFLRIGERKGPATPRIEAVARVWREAGFNAEACDDIERVVWEKLVCNVSFSGVCSVLERTVGEVIGAPATWSVASRCGQEALEVALAAGVAIGLEDAAAHVRSFGLRIAGAEPSMLLDLKAGRPCEIDFLNGAVARAGREVGVATPYNDVVTALVKAREATGSARASARRLMQP
jgi:2-dehydropantoate 2-reductase